MDELFLKGIRGLEVTPVAAPPRALPVREGLTFFQINRDSQREEWARVSKNDKHELAIRLNQNLLEVHADGSIQGQLQVSLKKKTPAAGAQASTMQFSLFLVQEQN